MEASKLVISVLLESYSIHMIALKLLSVLLIIYHQKFVKKNLTIKNLIFGHWDVFFMKWSL